MCTLTAVLPQASLQNSLDSQKNSLDLKKNNYIPKLCVRDRIFA